MRFSAICTRGTQVKEVPSDYFRLGQGVKGPLIVTFWRMWNLSSAFDQPLEGVVCSSGATLRNQSLGDITHPPPPVPTWVSSTKQILKKEENKEITFDPKCISIHSDYTDCILQIAFDVRILSRLSFDIALMAVNMQPSWDDSISNMTCSVRETLLTAGKVFVWVNPNLLLSAYSHGSIICLRPGWWSSDGVKTALKGDKSATKTGRRVKIDWTRPLAWTGE